MNTLTLPWDLPRSRTLVAAGLLLVGTALTARADVRQGLISYWPLDAIDGFSYTTADVVSGHSLESWGHDPTGDVVAGIRGKAIRFNPDAQTLLFFTNPEGEDTGLPVGNAPSWTVSVWVQASYPVAGESDRRVYSESSSTDDNPLVNLGTHNAGTDGTVDVFIRKVATQVNHVHSTRPAYDGAWHHLALVQEDDQLSLYIDGTLDSTIAHVPGTTPCNVTSLGAIYRQEGANVGAYFRGLIDEAAVWDRALTADEVREVKDSGLTLPIPAFPPVITQQPVGADDLRVGDRVVLSTYASGPRPLSFQWRKDGVNLPGETARALALDDLSEADSGSYSVVVSNSGGTVTSEAATMVVGALPTADLTRELLSHWPLDTIECDTTPDVVSGYDMELVNLGATDLVSGRFGQAFQFSFARQTMLRRIHASGDELPINQYPDFTISLWVNGPANQPDYRVFSEGSTASTSPLFNIGTQNGGADGTVDSFIRTDSNGGAGHVVSAGTAFDDTWHQIVYVQRQVGGTPEAAFYIDGVRDEGPALQPSLPLTLNTTTIGGIQRANPSHWFNGLIDDVALWTRALTEEEILLLHTGGTPDAPVRPRPLEIRSFQADLPALALGGTTTLRWSVSDDATVVIDGLGDVTGQTACGSGSQSVTLDSTQTFRLTLSRGADSLSAQVTVSVIDGVTAPWVLLDNFDRHAPGALAGSPWWQDLRGAGDHIILQGEDHRLDVQNNGQDDATAVLPLRNLSLKEGQQGTLFFRMRTPASLSPDVPVRHIVGLTDKNLRWYSDADGNVGPAVYVSNEGGSDTLLGARFGVGGAVDFLSDPLEPDTEYSVWIDIRNEGIEAGDLFSVFLQKAGDAQRTTIVDSYLSDRDPLGATDTGATQPDLDKLFVTTDADVSFQFDDFYLSLGTSPTSVPRAAGYTEVVGGSTGGTPTLGISRDGASLQIQWDLGTLETTTDPTPSGTWTAVPGATSPFVVTPTESARFYRARN